MKIQTLMSIGLGLCLILSSCTSNELTREKAGQIITDFYQYPNVDVEKFALSTMFGGAHQHASLIQQGYLAEPRGNFILPPDLEITERGSAYYVNQGFATSLRVFKEVTGIKFEDEGKTKATVEFTVTREKITPFGKFKNYKDGDEMNYTISLERYDDGWRVTSKSTKNFLPGDFPEVAEFK